MITEKIRIIVETLIEKYDQKEFRTQEYLLVIAKDIVKTDPEEWRKAMEISFHVKHWSEIMMIESSKSNPTDTPKWAELYWETYRFEAKYWFESFLIYMEKDRPLEKQFYRPRMKTLQQAVYALQKLEGRKIDFLGISMPSRTGKSTLCIFFMAWVMGRRPNAHNAMGGHSNNLAQGFYSETLNLFSNEYNYPQIFRDFKLEKKNAERLEINLDKPDRFPSLVCRGIDGTWTGAVDVSKDGYLYVDDLVRDRQESLSPQRMEKRWQDYLNVMVDRKIDGARELMVGTRWNVMDPLGRMEKLYKDNPKYMFLKIPALNDKDESNFEYDFGVGFSTKYYHDMRNRLDQNEWMAKYMQQPFIREGLVFEPDSLRYFNGILPDGGCRVVSACDVAWGGGDSLSMPIGFEYESGDVYIVDWLFSNGTKEETIPLVIGKILQYGIQQINFEANNGGEMYAAYVEEELRNNSKHKCSITSSKAPNTIAKMAKIIQYSGDIKRRFIFLSPNRETEEETTEKEKKVNRLTRSIDYNKAMDELCMCVSIGKNEHDDAPDSLVQLEMFCEGGMYADVDVPDENFLR